jgi:hypothetical protein
MLPFTDRVILEDRINLLENTKIFNGNEAGTFYLLKMKCVLEITRDQGKTLKEVVKNFINTGSVLTDKRGRSRKISPLDFTGEDLRKWFMASLVLVSNAAALQGQRPACGATANCCAGQTAR